MKKLLAIVLALTFVLGMVACTQPEAKVDPNLKSEGVMTYAQYEAAQKGDAVVIEGFVQAKQSWWDNKATVYLQDGEGAYFLYEMVCSEADYEKLTVGTKIKVTGNKTEWAGEIELESGCTFTFVETEDKWVAEPMDATALLGTDNLIKHQNKLAKFTDMTVVSVEYKNGEPGDDIYVKLSKGEAEYDFCVEYYLTGDDTEVYKAVGELKAGDVIDVEGFIYWYNSVNTHITAVTKK